MILFPVLLVRLYANYFFDLMKEEFEMNMMEELNFSWTPNETKNEGILIDQSKYANHILKRLGIDSAKPCATPKSPLTRIDKDDNGIHLMKKI